MVQLRSAPQYNGICLWSNYYLIYFVIVNSMIYHMHYIFFYIVKNVSQDWIWSRKISCICISTFFPSGLILSNTIWDETEWYNVWSRTLLFSCSQRSMWFILSLKHLDLNSNNCSNCLKQTLVHGLSNIGKHQTPTWHIQQST